MAKIALLIGVSEYEPGLTPLLSASRDVEALRQVLVNPEIGGFAETDVIVLTNPQRMEMERALDSLFADRHKDDLLLFYFSGHGIKDENGRLYLATRETSKEQGRLVKPTAVAARALHESMTESRSQRQVIILDCCFSGAIAQGLTVKDDGSVDIRAQLGGKGRAILTSSTSTQYSFEQEGAELSVYTRYLVEGLQTGAADQDGDGWISADELHTYAGSKVQEAAPAMTPRFYPVEEGYRIQLAKAPIGDPKLTYRKDVEVIVREDEGEISFINRSALDELRSSLGLSPSEAAAIEAEVLQPYRQRQAKLQRYEQVFTQAIAQPSPLTQGDRTRLKRLQQILKLRDQDVAPTQTRLTRSHNRRPTGQGLTRQQFLQSAGLGSVGLAAALVWRTVQNLLPPTPSPSPSTSPDPSPQPSLSPLPQTTNTGKLPLQSFEFERVTVDAQGKEASRRRQQATFYAEDLGNGVTLEMVSVPGGSFLMGSPNTEARRESDEGPQHSVTVPAFYMGKFEVTQAQWRIVAALPKVKTDLNPDSSYFKGNNRPVESVSWQDAVEFCARLSQKTGRSYRLPSEAEWEYACRASPIQTSGTPGVGEVRRAGTTTPFHFSQTITADLANYNGNYTYGSGPKGKSRAQTTEVGALKVANAFGLYDMHGNVWEWCADRWHDTYKDAPTDGSAWITGENEDYRLLRGGSWYHTPRNCRSANRFRSHPDDRDSYLGFRLAYSASRTS